MDNHDQLLRIGAAAQLINVTPSTLRRASREGRIPVVRTRGGHCERKFRVRDLLEFVGVDTTQTIVEGGRVEAHYARVSGGGQKQSLKDQLALLEQTRSGTLYKTYSDIGSGLNDHRRGLNKLIEDAQAGKFTVVRVVYPDRLSRFGIAYLTTLFGVLGVELEVLDEVQYKSDHEELVEDLLSLVASFSGKFYKMRSVENKRKTLALADQRLQKSE